LLIVTSSNEFLLVKDDVVFGFDVDNGQLLILLDECVQLKK
ncbi:4749_t:CDS:1, partial [Racocetra fulgida]